jgi:hypothetical protein
MLQYNIKIKAYILLFTERRDTIKKASNTRMYT